MINKIKLPFTCWFRFFLFTTWIPLFTNAQLPSPSLVGYFQNWQVANSPYIQLDQVDLRYNVIDVAFAIPKAGTDYNMEFIPDQVSKSTFISQIQTLHNQGRKVIISIGGATAPVTLNNVMERDTFISSMQAIINSYNFDGIDIDLEGSSLSITGGTITTPVDQPVINLIFAIKQIMANFYSQHNHRLILTMAPETVFIQGGQSAYSGVWGAYLPVVHALRDSLAMLHVQLYNSGTMYGIDGNIYTQGTADFIIAETEAVIHGFNTSGGFFNGLPASKVSIGLPACANSAGGGFTDTATVKLAIDYLRGIGPKPGSYTLSNPNGYPQLGGMMTWSINWDAVNTCGTSYQYARNYERIFGCPVPVASISASGPVTFCVGGNVTLSANSGFGLSYQWKKNGVNISGATSQLYNATGSGIYLCKVSNLCGTGTSNKITVVRQPLPASSITPNGTITFCAGNNALLQASPTGNYSYQWKKNGSNIVGATNVTFTAITAGKYKVIVTNNSTGCSKASVNDTVVVPCRETGVAEDVLPDCIIFPNPSTGRFIFNLNVVTAENISIAIYDVSGQLVEKIANEMMQPGLHDLEWDAYGNNINPGIYFMQMKSEDHIRMKKLIITGN